MLGLKAGVSQQSRMLRSNISGDGEVFSGSRKVWPRRITESPGERRNAGVLLRLASVPAYVSVLQQHILVT